MPLGAIRQNRTGGEIIQIAIRLGLLLALVYWCFVLVQPFIAILAWGVVLAVVLYPLHSWVSRHVGGRPKLAAAVITVLTIAILIGPAAWLGRDLVDGLRTISEQIAAGRLSVPSPPSSIKDWPLVGDRFYELWNQASSNLEVVFAQLAPHLKPLILPTLAVAGGVGVGALKFLASIILAGFLLPPGPRLVAAGKSIMARLMPERNEDFVALAGATIRTVSQGVIGIALLQAFLVGIGLKFAGFAYAGFLAFVVMILSILQLGAAIVLIPCLIWIWMTKDVASAVLLTAYLVLVGLADNVLKPLVMGRGLTTPMLVIFIGLLGGTLAHGIVGLFIGPIILAVGWQLMMAWIREDQIPDVVATAEHIPAEV
ncbi:AI-2E family transporter [Bradyrhizobium sp. NP1]|uniref:AI-2E family transporter n=1 Tax=Bradyrhizobium sp. NP1 TaxID=3049772 RepID=UPI0025A58106|nr:AI-2E family transporter [Bradyrhizobium sp. NP1]WJR79761.1 AI-2E family transporter [Bradyrhizobium sp. NP1]